MAGESGEIKRLNWADYCNCVHLFRAFRMAISPYRLGIAFCGLLALYLVGRTLDLCTRETYQPVVLDGRGMATTELAIFIGNNCDKAVTLKEIEDFKASGLTIKHQGTFAMLLQQSRVIINDLTGSAISLSPGGIVRAVISAGQTKLWLIRMHTGFAILFFAASLAVWAMVGGSICRLTALEVARDERIGPMEAIRFAREKFLSFLLAPVVPAVALLVAVLGLAIPGLIGALPFGEFVVGLIFGLCILVGFFMALIIVGSAGGGWLMHPTIAVEGSDAFDAISRSFGYLMARPWRTLFYLLVSMVYGALCLTFVKIVARLALACAAAGLGLSMNIAHVKTSTGGEMPKLEAIYHAPSLDFVSNPYTGTFATKPADKSETVAQYLIAAWVYGVATLVGAFVVSFAYSSFTIIYFLLRREVDATGFDDVYLDDMGPPPAATAPAAQPAKSGTSLPIIGQP